MTIAYCKKPIELFRKYSHLNFTLADQAMVSGVNFFTSVLLARAMGPEDFGAYTLAWFVVLFISSLQFSVISAPMMSIGPKQSKSRRPGYFGCVVAQMAAFAVTSSVIVLVGAKLSAIAFPEWHIGAIAIPLALATPAYQMRDFVRRYLFTRDRALFALLFDATTYGVQIGLLAWIAFRGRLDVADALWIVLVSTAVGLPAIAGDVAAMSLQWKNLLVIARRHWRFSRWLGASAVLQVISSQMFLIASGFLLGTAAVGALRASQNLMGFAQILFFGLQNRIPIRAGRHYQEGGVYALVRYIKRVAGAMELATGMIALIFAAVPEFWLNLLFGNEFAGNGHLVRLYAAVYLVVALSFPLNAGLWALETARPIFISYVIATLFGLSVAYPLLTHFGASGAASGILMTQIVMVTILFIGFVRRMRQIAGKAGLNGTRKA